MLDTVMRIEELTFSSVKSFNARQTVPLRDLTLIYGPNSSGKSSVFQCLLLLKQSVARAMATEPGVLEFRAGPADLGGFRTFVHQHDTARNITIGLRLSGAARSTTTTPNFFNDVLDIELSFGLRGDEDTEPHLVEVVLRDDAEVRFTHNAGSGALRLADAASSANLTNKWIRLYDEDAPRRPREYPDLNEADRRWLREWARKHDCDLNGWVPYWSLADFGRGKQGRPFGGSLDSPRNRVLTLFIHWWRMWVAEFTTALNGALRRVVYVGPLRDFPRRVATEASEGTGVGVRGERLVLHLARNPDLVDEVNAAFALMDIPYTLEVVNVLSETVQDALGDVAIAVLHDARTGVVLSPADVGFGLSQVLPVVVQLLGHRGATVLIEQPEIHLHPKVQSRLTDVLIRALVENGNRVLVETHSEHLLLRAQRRIRERSVPGFTNEQLGVQFVTSVDGMGVVKDLRVDESGGLSDPWPDGFFDERFDDLFTSL